MEVKVFTLKIFCIIKYNKRSKLTLDKHIYLECFPRHLKTFIPARTLNTHVIFSRPFLS